MTLTNLRIALLMLGLLALSACNGDLAVFPRDKASQAPQAPTGLTATPKAGEIVLRWQDNSDDETGFTVYRSEATATQTGLGQGVLGELEPLAEDFAKLATVPANTTSYVDKSVKMVMNYRYAVTAEGEEGASGRATTGEGTVPINSAPVATAQSVSTDEDTAVAITLMGSDNDGDTLSFAVVTQPTQGTLGTLDTATGEVSYTPENDYSGTDSFTFTVSDGEATSAPATVTIEVGGVNDAPVLTIEVPDQSTSQGATFSLDIAGNFSDPDGDTLSYSATLENGDPLPSWLTLSGSVLSGTPKNDDVGDYTVVVTVKDGGASASDTFGLSVSNTNDAPVIEGEETRTLQTNEDTDGTLTLSATDVDQNTLVWSIGIPATNGSAEVVDGEVTYTPEKNYNNDGDAPDSFTVNVSDGAASDSVTVNVTVTAVNDAPTANDQAQSTPEDTPLELTLSGSDVEESPLTFTIVDAPDKGSLGEVDQATGRVTYTPDDNVNGIDSFTFTVSDGELTSNEATVTLTLNTENDAPVAQDQTGDAALTTQEDTEVAVTLVATDVDEGDVLSYSVVSDPNHGTLSGEAPDLSYTPDENYAGPDSFTFKANDGTADSNVATVEITVSAVNDAPVIQDSAGENAGESVGVTMSEDGEPTPFALSLTASDPDLGEGTLTWRVSSETDHGSASVENGTVSYTPDENYNNENGEPDSFTVEVSDGELSDSLSVNVTVESVNDAPVVVSEIADQSVDEDTPFNLNVTGNFGDVDQGDVLSFTVSAVGWNVLPDWLSFTDGSFGGTPAQDDVGSFDVMVTAKDSKNAKVSDTFKITVNAVNDAPTSISLSNQTVEENQPAGTAVGSLSAEDSDSSSFTYSLPVDNSTDNASFSVDNDTDQLKTAESFDFENADDRSQTVRVRVSDGEATFEKSFTVTVTDVDDTGPAVTFSDPGQLTSGQQVTLTGTTSDAGGVSKVELFEDSTLLGTATLTNSTWTYDYTAPATAGTVTLKAVATDAAANSTETSRTLTVFSPVVSNLSDNGPGSLRWTVANAPADTTITFAQSLSGGTITLTSGQITLSKNVTIQGFESENVTVSGNNASRVLYIDRGVTAELKNLTITRGESALGGGVFNRGTLTLQDKGSISNNSASYGGGVNNRGNLTLQGSSSISNNSASYGGGVDMDNGGTLTLQGSSSISGNSAEYSGGGINKPGVITLQDNSSISNNSAPYGSGGGVDMDNGGTLILQNSSSISGNSAGSGGGGGVDNGGTLTLQDSSSIRNNSTPYWGGGVYNHGTLTLQGNSSISGNSATYGGGGGVNNRGTLTLQDSSSISGNSSIFGSGGGVFNYGGTLNGADYDGANGDDNIFDNTPDQVRTQ